MRSPLRLSIVVSAFAVAALTFAVPASAQNAHFIGTPDCTKNSNTGVLTCSGKAAGLGNGPTAAFLTADSVTATFECVNKGGNVAPGQPVVLQNVTGPTQNITPRNGQITFSPTLSPPPSPSARDTCPNGNWSVRRTSLTYNNVVLHIQQPPGTDVLTFNAGTIDP
jgi:hypothetical protein